MNVVLKHFSRSEEWNSHANQITTRWNREIETNEMDHSHPKLKVEIIYETRKNLSTCEISHSSRFMSEKTKFSTICREFLHNSKVNKLLFSAHGWNEKFYSTAEYSHVFRSANWRESSHWKLQASVCGGKSKNWASRIPIMRNVEVEIPRVCFLSDIYSDSFSFLHIFTNSPSVIDLQIQEILRGGIPSYQLYLVITANCWLTYSVHGKNIHTRHENYSIVEFWILN